MGAKAGSGAAYGGSAMPQVTGAEGTDVSADINMTPMIDIMLVLLIIFMVITPAVGAAVKPPIAVNTIPQKEERVTLGIERSGKYMLDDRPVKAEQLGAALQAAYQARPDDHILYLKADAGVEYSAVLTAIDLARHAGVRKIGAITEAPKGAAAGS